MRLMIDQLIRVTPQARAKIDGVRTFNDFPEAVLRVRVVAKEGPRFRYEIALEDPRERTTTISSSRSTASTWRSIQAALSISPAPRSISIRR